MSLLLDQLRQAKGRLKPARTVVTRPDGQRYLETGDAVVDLDRTGPGYVVDLAPDDRPAQILDRLFLGSQDCCDEAVLRAHDIGKVLSVGVEAPVRYARVAYKYVEMLDVPDANLSACLDECLDFIEAALDEGGGNVLVHCNAGVSRSASVVIAFLMLRRGRGFREALDAVSAARRCVRPNDGFLKQLESLKPI